MLIVPNHHVIVPQTKDIAFHVDEIKSTDKDIIYVELFGDSIMCGRNPDEAPPAGGVCNNNVITGRVTQPPGELISLFLPQYRILVTTRSSGNSTSGELLLGTDGVNGPWPDNIEANIVVINHGINDAQQAVPVNQYKNNLIALRQGLRSDQILVWQTPTKNSFVDVGPYAQAMKEVALQFQDIIANAYTLENWINYLPNGLHPRQLGYVQLVDRITAPAIGRAITKYLGTFYTHRFYRSEQQQKFVLENKSEITLDFKPAVAAWVEIYYRDNPIFQVISRGYRDQSRQLTSGFYDYQTGKQFASAGRSFNLLKVKRDSGQITQHQIFDVFADPDKAMELATELNRTNSDYIVVIYTHDEPKTNRTHPALLEALLRCGASSEVINSPLFRFGSAYILVGIPGVGVGKGYETYSGDTDNDIISYCEINFELLSNGELFPLDIYPVQAIVKDSSRNNIVISNPNYKTVTAAPLVNGTRIINASRATQNTGIISKESYNVVGNKIYFETPLTGDITVVCDTQSTVSPNAHVIDMNNIHSYDYYTHRFHRARWARGNPQVTLGNAAVGPLAPAQFDSAQGVNSLGITNTYVNMRVGDAHYAEPVVLSQPTKGYVKLTADRKKMAYVPYPNTVGLDSFSYTFLTQYGQTGLPASAYVEIIPGPPNAIYSLSTNKNIVDEGNTVTITLTTTNVSNGTLVPYAISGVSLADINETSFQGNFLINNGVATVTFGPVRDFLTEGTEILTLSLLGSILPPQKITVNIGDTSKTPFYSLSANVEAVNEGGMIEFTLNTNNVENGTAFPYTISGIGSTDIVQVLTGSFTVNNNTANTKITVVNDNFTEGTEFLSLVVNNILPTLASVVSIIDTSKTPNYQLTANRSTINEGESVRFTLTTSDVNSGTNIAYTISGVSVINDLLNVAVNSGVFNIVNNTAFLVLTTSADKTTETNETLKVTLNNVQATGNIIEAQVSITDSSKTPTYTFTSNRNNINEGQSVRFTLTTTDVDDNTVIPYTISGVNVTTDLVSVPVTTGTLTIQSNVAEVDFTANTDRTTEGPELLRITLNNDTSVFGQVIINDTSLNPVYTLTANRSNVNEGDTIKFNFVVSPADTFPQPALFNYIISGIDPSTDLVGNIAPNQVFVVNNGLASVSYTLRQDRLTENTETMTVTVPAFNTVLLPESITTSVTINDTSGNPSYSLSILGDVEARGYVREQEQISIRLQTTGIDDGTQITATIQVSPWGLNYFFYPTITTSITFVINGGVGLATYTVPRNSFYLERTFSVTIFNPPVQPPPTVFLPIRQILLCNESASISPNQRSPGGLLPYPNFVNNVYDIYYGPVVGNVGISFNPGSIRDSAVITWPGPTTVVVDTGFVAESEADPNFLSNIRFNKNQVDPPWATLIVFRSVETSTWSLQVVC